MVPKRSVTPVMTVSRSSVKATMSETSATDLSVGLKSGFAFLAIVSSLRTSGAVFRFEDSAGIDEPGCAMKSPGGGLGVISSDRVVEVKMKNGGSCWRRTRELMRWVVGVACSIVCGSVEECQDSLR